MDTRQTDSISDVIWSKEKYEARWGCQSVAEEELISSPGPSEEPP